MQPIIDAHHHLWQLGKNIHYPWLEDAIDNHFFLGDYSSIRKDFGIKDLQKMVPEGYELIGSVHCEAEAGRTDALKEAQWIDDLSQQYQLPCAQSVWVDLSSEKVPKTLEDISHISSVRGVRWKPVVAKNAQEALYIKKEAQKNTLKDKTWQYALVIMEKMGLIWELRVPAWHLYDAAQCLLNYPKLKVIINHCGLPWDRTKQGIQQWHKGMELLAENQHVAIKLSELGSPNKSRDLDEDKQLLIRILQLFGGKRCLFASNMPVSSVQISYQNWLDTVASAIHEICPENKDDVFWRNAMCWYDIKSPNTPQNII